MNRALNDKGRRLTEDICKAVNAIWEAEIAPQPNHRQGRGRARQNRPRPATSWERALERATERELEIRGYRAWQAQRVGTRRRRRQGDRVRGPGQPQRRQKSAIDEWANLEWKRRWLQSARDKEAATWKTPWGQDTIALYSDLPKHQATALFLLRTEVIGLNGWLASINVPGIDAKCDCGWRTQTVRHVLMMCPLHSNARADLVRRTDSEDVRRMLSTPEKAQATARWFVQQGILRQFDLAREIEKEGEEGCTPFRPLNEVE